MLLLHADLDEQEAVTYTFWKGSPSHEACFPSNVHFRAETEEVEIEESATNSSRDGTWIDPMAIVFWRRALMLLLLS